MNYLENDVTTSLANLQYSVNSCVANGYSDCPGMIQKASDLDDKNELLKDDLGCIGLY